MEYVVITPSQLTITTNITTMGAMEMATAVFSHSMSNGNNCWKNLSHNCLKDKLQLVMIQKKILMLQWTNVA
jgi:hypothetical protein